MADTGRAVQRERMRAKAELEVASAASPPLNVL